MKFKFNPSPGDKEAQLEGPIEANIFVDFDDVDHTTVEREVRKLCALLNKHWNKKPRRSTKKPKWKEPRSKVPKGDWFSVTI